MIMTSRTGENAGSREAAGLGQFLQFGKEQTDALMSLQKELSDAYEQVTNRWASRVKSEVELWSELGKKVTASRSVPEGLEAYRDGVAQRLQMAAEDGAPAIRGRPKGHRSRHALVLQWMAERQTRLVALREEESDLPGKTRSP
jgi:hypothetical protein